MNSIISNYNTTIEEFRNAVKSTSVIPIDDIISILNRIESYLFIYELQFKDIRYGKKFLKRLKKIEETKFRISTLENSVCKEKIAKYLTYLKKQESDLNSQIQDFNARKELKFPTVKKKNIITDDMFRSKTEKYLRKIEKFIAIQSDDIEDDLNEIFKSFNKFNKIVLASSNLNILDEKNTSVLNPSLKLLNDIIRHENLISELYTYYKKNIEQVENLIDVLEHEKMMLIDTFESEEDKILDICRMIVKNVNNKEINNDLNLINDPNQTIS